MGFSETIRLLIDVDSTGSTSGIKALRTELGNTDGAFNKMKVGATGAFDLLKQNAAAAALFAGAALVGFATQAVGAFQDTALGAGKLRDALGVTAEEASRLQEVAGDLGIGVGALETTMGRMNRTAETTPEAFDAIGAAIARNSDGTINVTQTFLNVIDALNRIPDASVRAQRAQEIFGRSWMDISELVATGAKGVQEAIDSVETGKVMSDADIARARKFRDTLDEVKGIVEEATVAIGERIVPVLQLAADAFMTAKAAAESLLDVLPDAAQDAGFDPFSSWGDITEDFQRNAEVILQALGLIEQELQGSLDPTLQTTAASSDALATALQLDPEMRAVAEAAEETAEALKRNAEAFIPVIGGYEDLAAAAAAAEEAMQSQADAVIASLDSGIALRDAQRDAAAAFAETDAVIGNQESSLQDVAAALDEAKSAALDVAGAQIQMAEDTATAEGRTFTHADKVRTLKNSLLEQASAIQGPVHDALMELVATLDTIPEEAGPTVTVPGATESTAQLRETGRAAIEMSDEEQVVTSAPGATESTAQLRETDRTARAMTDDEQVVTTAPGATESTAQLRETDRAARAMSNEEQVPTSAPGATTATGQLWGVDEAARSIPGSRNTTVTADDNATGILERIRNAIAAIQSKTVTIGVNYVPIGGSLLAKGSKSSQPGDIAGEAGPELLKFKSGRQAIVSDPTMLPGGVEVTPLDSMAHRVGTGGGVFDQRNPRMARGGDTYINVTVVAPLGSNSAEFGRRIAQGIQDHSRLNGNAWIPAAS